MTPTLSLETSKKLVELGMKLETEKWWIKTKWRDFRIVLGKRIKGVIHIYPAPSSDELLEVMPDWSDANDMMGIIVFRDCGIYFVQLKRYLSDAYKVDFNSESLSEALGKMCLWLLENGYHYDKEKGLIK
jgi:hypothetical protein